MPGIGMHGVVSVLSRTSHWTPKCFPFGPLGGVKPVVGGLPRALPTPVGSAKNFSAFKVPGLLPFLFIPPALLPWEPTR